MMFSTPAGPPRSKPTPLDGPDLHVHPHRSCAIDPMERQLVALFLQRYIVWTARRRQIERVRNALGLFTEISGLRVNSER